MRLVRLNSPEPLVVGRWTSLVGGRSWDRPVASLEIICAVVAFAAKASNRVRLSPLNRYLISLIHYLFCARNAREQIDRLEWAMSTPSVRGRPIAILASLLLAIGALTVLPVTPLGRPLVAEASVTAGDIIFGQAHGNDPTVLTQLHGSTTTNLSTGSTDSDYYPDVSPDGSRIVFSGYRLLCSDSHIYECLDLVVMNSDGSGQRIIATGAAL